jgi:hypothetical protein
MARRKRSTLPAFAAIALYAVKLLGVEIPSQVIDAALLIGGYASGLLYPQNKK